ncbi:hypothetical protein VFPPC_17736 [Pochonia chlamydosporia 170]|uniref:Uncharacterized protein n=1 Tax=Pochonia chlamydosporia 170 TaxID=1380566 RepID=A0A219AQN5_METCM|nr:hypothetical protein VFPPC_17736 [Pochonia chlamydosporia 170]OWT43088.1 hypothetical protein VFPPC_17736 [Pochonia chlamydosporia 170]
MEEEWVKLLDGFWFLVKEHHFRMRKRCRSRQNVDFTQTSQIEGSRRYPNHGIVQAPQSKAEDANHNANIFWLGGSRSSANRPPVPRKQNAQRRRTVMLAPDVSERLQPHEANGLRG